MRYWIFAGERYHFLLMGGVRRTLHIPYTSRLSLSVGTQAGEFRAGKPA
jgi:hypothetical protein